MKTKKIKLCEVSSTVLFIGFEGEQNYRRVEIDATEVFAEMPDAVPSMAIKPPVGDVYPKALERDGNTIVWEISASDCATVGDGAYQLTFIDGESIGKEFKGYFKVFDALVGSGEAPEPIEDFVEFANAVLAALQNMTASAETIPASEPATAEITQIGGHKNLALGIPAGEPGIDGISPTISITDIPGGHRLTVTDANGTHTFDVMDGTPGAPGQDGQDGTDGTDGVSPTVTVTDITGGHQVTITDVSGAHTFNVMDGMGDTSLIAKDYADMTFPVAAGVYCVKDNVLYKAKEAIATQEAWTAAHWLACSNVGTELSSLKSTISVLEPVATSSDVGKFLKAKTVSDGKVTEYEFGSGGGGGGGTSDYNDLSNKPQINSVTLSGNKSLDALGIAPAGLIAPYYEDLTFPVSAGTYCIHNGTLYSAINDIQTSEAWNPLRWVSVMSMTDRLDSNETAINEKPSASVIATDYFAFESYPIPAGAYCTYEGLLYVSNQAIQTPEDFDYNKWDFVDVMGEVAKKYTKPSSGIPASDLASGVIPSVPVTDIQSGGVSIVNNGVAEINPVVSVSGTTPTITAVSGTRYICGECSTLTITAPASGCIDVTFTSGSTPTILTVSSAKSGVTAIKWVGADDPASLEANKTYEINILDGEYGVIASWT